MQSANDLKQLLLSINHKSYPAYKSTRGAYQFPRYTLSIDHVQGDPFAAPSRVSVHVSGKTAAFPAFLYDTYEKRVALQDYLLRQFARAIAPYSFRAKGSGKSGLLGISRCGQEILEPCLGYTDHSQKHCMQVAHPDQSISFFAEPITVPPSV